MKTSGMKFIGITAAAIAAFSLAGCSSIGAFNPFSKKEQILPGERRSAIPESSGQVAAGSPSIGGPSEGAEWSQSGGNSANAPGNVGLAGNGSSAAWRVRALPNVGKSGVRPGASPLVYGGRVLVYDAGGNVTALSNGGAKAWSASLAPQGEKGRPTGGGIAASGNAVYAATGYGEVVALDASSGGRIWTAKLGAPAHSAPAAAGGKVFIVTAKNVLHAINQADGSEAWQYPGIPETAGVLSSASPAVSGNTVVVPYSSGEVIAFDTGSGELKWADAVTRSSRTLAVSGLPDVAASPVIVDGVVYATGVAGRTIAVGLSSGERLWEANVGSASTPAVSGNAIFVVDLEGNLIAMNRSNGGVFWQTALPAVKKRRFVSVWAGPTLAGGILWAVSNDGRMVGVDPGTGTIVADRKLSSPAYVKPIAASGQLIVLSRDGTLTAFR